MEGLDPDVRRGSGRCCWMELGWMLLLSFSYLRTLLLFSYLWALLLWLLVSYDVVVCSKRFRLTTLLLLVPIYDAVVDDCSYL